MGDAFGEQFFYRESSVQWAIDARQTPNPPWRWTDDTAMALSIVETLAECRCINQDGLAQHFAARYASEPSRGYGKMAHEILSGIVAGVPWRNASSAAFGGAGSMGNGSAMRAGPIGAYFADDLDAVVVNASLSAEVTHFHQDGKAGAVAVAVAAAVAWRLSEVAEQDRGQQLLHTAVELTPRGPTRDRLQWAMNLPFASSVETAVHELGNGSQVLCQDTVPFCLWCAARHLDHYEEALWTTVAGLGDRDTTCAIVGSIVALSAGPESIPSAWRASREELN